MVVYMAEFTVCGTQAPVCGTQVLRYPSTRLNFVCNHTGNGNEEDYAVADCKCASYEG